MHSTVEFPQRVIYEHQERAQQCTALGKLLVVTCCIEQRQDLKVAGASGYQHIATHLYT